MAVATRVLALSAQPVDVTALADIAAEIAARGRVTLTLQATAIGKTVVFAEQAAAPAAGSRDGFILTYRDTGIVRSVRGGLPIWIWSTTTATVAISQGPD